ncbi:MAG: arginine deiminase family protein [Anaerolineaceae bacterium]
MKIQVNSEIGKLNAVMLQSPGKELTRMTPANVKSLNWDNIPWLTRAQEEQCAYRKALASKGAKVYVMQDLLKDLLDDKKIRDDLIVKSIEFEKGRIHEDTAIALKDIMDKASTDELIDIFTGGVTKKELETQTSKVALADLADPKKEFCLTPMTNISWSRDPAASIGEGLVFSKMACKPREREPLYVKAIFKNHPEFKDLNYKVWYGDSPEDTTTIEGGDIFPISKNALMIGQNERTNPITVMKLAERLFANSEVTDVLGLKFKNIRFDDNDLGMYIHVDCVMTMVDYDAFLFYPGVKEVLSIYHISKGKNGELKTVVEDDVFETLKKIFNLKSIRVIEVGDGDPTTAIRENHDMGANVFTVAPGVVCSYTRNEATNNALRKNGIEVIPIEGNELTKCLGGPRCATMPLWRDDVKW